MAKKQEEVQLKKRNPNLLTARKPDLLPVKNPVGRPTKFTPELGRKICKLMADGKSLLDIQKIPGMPIRGTIMDWYFSEKFPNFNKLYDEARERRADFVFEEAKDIADGVEAKIVGDDKSDGARVQAQKLRVDTRKWFAGVLAPRKFAGTSKVDLTSNGKELKEPRAVTINYVVPS